MWGGLAQEATKKYRGPAGRNNRHVFPTILEVESPSSRGQLIRFPVRIRFLAGRWPSSHCGLTWQREEALLSLPLAVRTLIPSWWLHPHDLI